MVITDWNDRECPGARLLEQGAASLSDAELVALMLHTGYRGCSAVELARDLLVRLNGLRGLLRASQQSLLAIPGIGPAKCARLRAAPELAKRQAMARLCSGDVMGNPADTRHFLQLHLGGHGREVFSCLFLDSQHRVLRCDDLFFGTLDGAAVYPREVALRALQSAAAAVIFAHNHPSGVSEPSTADRQITQRLQQALALLDIRVLDHIIVGSGTTYSFAEHGLL